MAAEEQMKEALLKKHYENCPGCKVERLRELQRGLPIKQLVSMWIVVLCTGNCLFGCEETPFFLFSFYLNEEEDKKGKNGTRENCRRHSCARKKRDLAFVL